MNGVRSKAKKRKKPNVVREDRISKLPDPLLHHILSFLPTECAVSTTVLSKRWENVWISVPVLDFRNWEHEDGYGYSDDENGCDDEDGYEYRDDKETIKFMDFVDRVLAQRNMLNIKKFCLKCENEYFDHKRVNAWITKAIECEVEEFIFSECNSHPSDGKMIPDSLFTCQSLTTLDFQFPELNVLHLPNSISLPRLKILRLTSVAYEDEKSVGKLFSSCPVLEELCLTDCGWENVEFIRVSAPRLKSFILTGCLGSYMYLAKVDIDAPNLLSFTFCDWLPEDFIVGSFPLLQVADLYYNYGDIESRFLPLSKFVMKLCNVKVLKISGAYFKILKLANALSTSFPTFHNLIRLKVYDICSLLQMETFVNFLEFLPNLEALVINKVEFDGEVNENTLSFIKVPSCLECLKTIKIKRVKGYPKELELVKFVLKHAKVLQTIIMHISYPKEDSWDFRKMKNDRKALNKKIMMQLRTSPWASPEKLE